MKKIISILLLLVLTAPVAGTFTWLQIKKQLIKKEVKWKMIDGLDRDELVLLKFTHNQTKTLLKWKHAREFEFNGEMYDIVEMKTEGDTLFYYCWWDHEETTLNMKLNKLVAHAAGKNSQTRDKVNHLWQFFKSLYFTEDQVKPDYSVAIGTDKRFLYVFVVKSTGISPPAPPPKPLHNS